MKRVKESGAFFRKEEAKEAELKKYEGAILKFVTSSGSNVSLTIPENDLNENPDNKVELQKYTEEISLSAKRKKQGLSKVRPMESFMQYQLHMETKVKITTKQLQ